MTETNTASGPGATLTRSERWKLRLGTMAWFLAFGLLLISLPVLLDIGWWAPLLLLALALVLALPIAFLVRRLFSRQRRQRAPFTYFKTALASLAVLAGLVATPVYALAMMTAINPLTVPTATLTNGGQTVIFQGMMHVGSEGFYKSVVYDLERALTEDYVIFYEGVTSDPAGDAWFSQTLAGGGDLSASYQRFGSACGLDFQLDYFDLLEADMAARPERHVKADVSTADMKAEYDRLAAADPAFAARVEAARTPASDQAGGSGTPLFDLIDEATPGQKALIGAACRGWMSWMLGQQEQPSDLDPIIIDFRNRKLAERIAAGPDKIFITYGAHHLADLLDKMQADDPAWQIASVKWMRAIDTPEDLSGEIQ